MERLISGLGGTPRDRAGALRDRRIRVRYYTNLGQRTARSYAPAPSVFSAAFKAPARHFARPEDGPAAARRRPIARTCRSTPLRLYPWGIVGSAHSRVDRQRHEHPFFGPMQVATALGAVPLYTDLTTDPVLGQKFVFSCTRDP